jgi:RteC protein
MIPFYNKTISDLDDQLHFISLETDDVLRKSELSIQTIQLALAQLKEFVCKYKFKSQAEEIKFFKEQKPEIFSKLSYHVRVYNIEMHKPNGSDKAKKRYLQNELNNIEIYFTRNLEFIKYYRTKKIYLDHKYFIRGKHDLSLTLDTFYFETDPKFSTSHDYKVSKVKANELLEIYLKTEIDNIDKKDKTSIKSLYHPKVKLTWTNSKASLIELIYALQSLGVFNNTTASVKDIVSYFESVFNADLSHFYTTFQEIKERRGNQTQFLKLLQETLQKRINEKDDKL